MSTFFRRRDVLSTVGLATAGTIAAPLMGTAAIASTSERDDQGLTTTEEKLRALVKTIGSLDPSEQTWLYSHGTGYAIAKDGRTMMPWFKVYMLISIRNLKGEEGYRQLSNQIYMFGDLEEENILDTWKNPVTDKNVSIFHGHNGPMNIELKPYQLRLGADSNVKEKVPFHLPWERHGDLASLKTTLTSERPNPLDKSWGDAFTGPMVKSTEWVQWTVPYNDLVSPAINSVVPAGSITRHSGWYPWMMMGQNPGSFMTQMSGSKMDSLEALPKHVREYAEKYYPEYLVAPREWTGKYVDLMSVYKKERSVGRR